MISRPLEFDCHKAIKPNHTEIPLIAIALMEDGSNGLAGKVRWPKGKTPILKASTDILKTTGQLALSGIEADTYGGRIGKGVATSGLTSTGSLIDPGRPLPIITVEAYTPLKVYVKQGF